VIRGLFERERRLLAILSRCAHRSVQTLLREVVDDPRAQVGTVASLQTFGSFAANFHPHVHALITEGAFHVPRHGAPSFEPVPWWDRTAMTELFRRLVLAELRGAQRLREETEQMLLGWHHPGFSVHATEPIQPEDTARQEHLARYITRAPLRLDAVERQSDTTMMVRTPTDPRTSQRDLELDPLLCPLCQVVMKPVSVIDDAGVVDRILAHLRRIGGNDPWEGTAQRGPPAA